MLMHAPHGLARALASLLANKLASRTLLPMQLAGLFLQAYAEDEVRSVSLPPCLCMVLPSGGRSIAGELPSRTLPPSS